MDIILVFLISLGAFALILIIVNAFLIYYSYDTNKKINKLIGKGKVKELKDIILSQKDTNKELEEKIKKAFLKIKDLEGVCERTIQKTGIVRFNPFNEMGGNQSFVIALLDDKNNGFVISSLFVKEGNRVYAKAVKDGKSDHLLSGEELEAIIKAIKSKQK